MSPLSPRAMRSAYRVGTVLRLGIALGISVWVGIDVYGRSIAPGPRILWAFIAGSAVLAAFTAFSRAVRRLREDENSIASVTDARGERRTVAHSESAGILATQLSRADRAAVSSAALPHWQTRYSLPSRRLILLVALTFVLLWLSYGTPAPLVQPAVLAGSLLLLHGGRRANSLAPRMRDAYLARAICPACTYTLRDLPTDSDGATVCPECNAAWLIP